MNQLFQHGTLGQLMAGQMQGTLTLEELLKHGDHGIGTLSGVDGEVIIVDGEVYQASSDGVVHHISDLKRTVPFADVHFWDSQLSINTYSQVTLVNLLDQLGDFPLKNIFAGIKLHGEFQNMHIRIAPKQVEPYPSLLAVTDQQPEFTAENIKGTLVGYFAPHLFAGATAAGFHLHFISDDRQFAGHVLEFTADELRGNVQMMDSFVQNFPTWDTDFLNYDQDMDGLHEKIQAAEGVKK